jgi:predicted RNA-binding protein with PIN domain
MTYLIDGHNLIPKIPGLRLDDPEDERKLIELLQAYCRQARKSVEVFFDGAPSGSARKDTHGRVTVHFIHKRSSADQAIHQRLTRLKKEAANYTVVSSDHQVLNAARRYRAKVLTADKFARQILSPPDIPGEDSEEKPDLTVSPDEIQNWLREFQQNPDE